MLATRLLTCVLLEVCRFSVYKCYLVNQTEPRHNNWSTAIASGIIQQLGWTSVTIITDHDTEAGVSQLLESTDVILYANLRVGPETTRASLKGNLKHVQLLKSRHRNYLVICGRTCITDVIDVVNNLDAESCHITYTRRQSRWLVMESPYMASSDGFPDLMSLGNQLDNLAVMNHTADDIEVNTLMWVPGGREWRQVNMEMCRGKCALAAQIFPNTITGYNGRQLTVALMEWRQFIIKSESNGSTIYKGHCIDLLDIMAYLLNFTYVLVEPPDRRWGVEVDGHWDGIVRQLIDREVDLTVAPLAMSSERQRVIDFLSTPISYEYSDVAFRRLDQTVSKWRLLLDLFHPKVYLCLAVALVTVSSILAYIVHRTEGRTHGVVMSFAVSLWHMYACMCQRGGLIPRTGSGRMLVSSWCLFSMIMASIFSGKLIATLAVPKTPTPFHSLTELLDSEQYTLGIVGGEAHQQFISESTDDVLLRLWHTIMKHNKTDPSVTSSNVSEHMDRVLLGEYALVYTRHKEETPWSCDVDFLGQKIAVFTASLAMPKNSPIASDFNKLLMILTDRGILQKLEDKWLSASSTCATTTSRTRPVTEQDLQSAFYTLIIGIVSAFVVLGIELLYVRIVKAS